MYEVLMPVDSSESRGRAQAKTVIDMPRSSDSVRVTLLYVFEDTDRERETAVSQVKGGSVAHSLLREADITVEQVSRVGDPAAEILAVAEELDADHLVLGGRKRSPLGSLLFGSVSQAVLLDCDRAVTITGGEK